MESSDAQRERKWVVPQEFTQEGLCLLVVLWRAICNLKYGFPEDISNIVWTQWLMELCKMVLRKARDQAGHAIFGGAIDIAEWIHHGGPTVEVVNGVCRTIWGFSTRNFDSTHAITIVLAQGHYEIGTGELRTCLPFKPWRSKGRS